MREIIKDIEKLKNPAEPLIIIGEKGEILQEAKDVVNELKEVMEANKDILALSGPQIGINKRIFGIRFQDIIKIFINPIITKKKESSISPETFVSMPGKEILLARPKEITVVYYNSDFKYEDNKLLDAAARIFEQQAQLLDGITPDDLGLVSDIETDGKLSDLTEEDFNEIVKIYKQFTQTKAEALKEHLKNESGYDKLYNKLKFTEDVINGRTQVIQDNPGLKLNRAQRRALAKKNRRK